MSTTGGRLNELRQHHFSGPGDVIKKGIRKLKDLKYGLQAVVVYWNIIA